MNKIILSGKEFFINYTRQVINMGGPEIGEIGTMEDGLIATDCIYNNYIFDDKKGLLYFVKYYSTTRWRSGTYFAISVYDINERCTYEYQRKFDAVYIERLLDKSKMEIYLAFHNQLINTKNVFFLEAESCKRLEY